MTSAMVACSRTCSSHMTHGPGFVNMGSDVHRIMFAQHAGRKTMKECEMRGNRNAIELVNYKTTKF